MCCGSACARLAMLRFTARRAGAEAEARASASAEELARVRSAAESELAAQRTAAKEALAEGTATACAHAEEQLQAALGQVRESVTPGTGTLTTRIDKQCSCTARACTTGRGAANLSVLRSRSLPHRRSLRNDAHKKSASKCDRLFVDVFAI